jgi:hypothetical protein
MCAHAGSLHVCCTCTTHPSELARPALFVRSCDRSEDERDGANGDGPHHQLSEKDAAKAARRAAAVQKIMAQIKQLDDLVRCVG